MSDPSKNPHGAVPHSSGQNRFATQRTIVVTVLIVGVLLLAIWIPW